MSEIKRLVDDPFSVRAEELLRSAETDGPMSQKSAQARTLAAVQSVQTAARAAAAARTRTTRWAGHVVGVTGALGILALVTFVALSPSSSLDSLSVRQHELGGEAPVTGPASTGTQIEDVPSAAAEMPSPTRDTPPVKETRDELRPVAPAVRRVPGPTVTSEKQFEDELAAIDAARAALSSGNADIALIRVHGYQRRFTDGRFAEEAAALEIQALAAVGRREEAQAKAERFLTSHPRSTYGRRIRSLLPDNELNP